jgi:hypothetical protein
MTKSSPDSPTRSPAQPIDGAASNADGASEPEIHVRFRYEMWHVEGASPEYDLLFDDLVEAEQYAVQVARHSAAEVVVHGEDDEIIARRQHDHLD